MPVSYTHLDVYKRQDKMLKGDFLPEGSFIIVFTVKGEKSKEYYFSH